MVARGKEGGRMGEVGKGNQEVQTCDYKIKEGVDFSKDGEVRSEAETSSENHIT